MGSASAEKVGWEEVGVVKYRVLRLAVRKPLLALRKCYSHCGRGFISGREGCLGSEQVFASRRY